MNVLAIDTSHATGSVAVASEGSAVREERFGDGSSHLSSIGAAVRRALDARALSLARVERIALVTGPGSFTGLRIGMAFAKGLYAGLSADLVVMRSLDLLAMALAAGGRPVCAMIDARKDEVYAAVFATPPGAAGGAGGGAAPGDPTTLVEPTVGPPGRVARRAAPYSPVFAGSGALRYRREVERAAPGCTFADEAAAVPSSGLLARVAPRLEPLDDAEVADLEPFYIRASGAVFKPLRPVDPHAHD